MNKLILLVFFCVVYANGMENIPRIESSHLLVVVGEKKAKKLELFADKQDYLFESCKKQLAKKYDSKDPVAIRECAKKICVHTTCFSCDGSLYGFCGPQSAIDAAIRDLQMVLGVKILYRYTEEFSQSSLMQEYIGLTDSQELLENMPIMAERFLASLVCQLPEKMYLRIIATDEKREALQYLSEAFLGGAKNEACAQFIQKLGIASMDEAHAEIALSMVDKLAYTVCHTDMGSSCGCMRGFTGSPLYLALCVDMFKKYLKVDEMYRYQEPACEIVDKQGKVCCQPAYERVGLSDDPRFLVCSAVMKHSQEEAEQRSQEIEQHLAHEQACLDEVLYGGDCAMTVASSSASSMHSSRSQSLQRSHSSDNLMELSVGSSHTQSSSTSSSSTRLASPLSLSPIKDDEVTPLSAYTPTTVVTQRCTPLSRRTPCGLKVATPTIPFNEKTTPLLVAAVAPSLAKNRDS